MNKRIRKKHKWKYYHKKFWWRFICETREETFKLVVNYWVHSVTMPKCSSLKCDYVYRRNVKRAAKWAVENDLRNWQPAYKHLRFARHLQPKENNDE